MSEFQNFRYLLRAPRGDVAVLLTSFMLTILVDLTVAVEVGIVLASLLFMKRMSEVGTAIIDTPIFPDENEIGPESLESDALIIRDLPPNVEIFEIYGPFFFGVADTLKESLSYLEQTPRVFILRMRKVPVIDATGLQALREFFLKCRRAGTVLILSGVQPRVARKLERIGITEEIGTNNVCPSIDKALHPALPANKTKRS